MPTFITIAIAKLLSRLSMLLGRGSGTALPGLVAEKIDRSIGTKLAKTLPYGAIIITGTNGKTTTAKMLSRALSDAGFLVVANRAGSNLSRGLVSTLIENSTFSGKVKGKIGVFEVDEASMPAAVEMLQPKANVVLNLFRDQLDRYGELDSTAKLIGSALAASGAEIYLNADDPLVATLKTYANDKNVHYFGLKDAPIEKLEHDVTADSAFCPECTKPLDYSKNFFGHIGHYVCPDGHFERPQPEFQATDVGLLSDGSTMLIENARAAHQPVKLNIPGVYNIYNAVAAFAVANNAGLETRGISNSLGKVEAAFGRVEQIEIDGKKLYILLIKNPTGFNQIIQTFLLDKKKLNVLIQINDNFADGRDISWLWDVAFEELENQEHSFMAGGIRATDLAVRFKYAGMPIEVKNGVSDSLQAFLKILPDGGTGYVIPTYTAMLETRRILRGKTDLPGVSE